MLYLLYINVLINCCGDIRINPDPKQSFLAFPHRNLNGLAAHDSIKISLLRGCITDRNFDIICLSETFLNCSLDRKDDRLKIEGYNLIRSDNPNGLKKEAYVSIIRNIFLSLEETICSLSNCLVTEICLENEKCFLICLYRSPNQNQHEFLNFCANLDTLMDHIHIGFPTCSALIGDFNGRC